MNSLLVSKALLLLFVMVQKGKGKSLSRRILRALTVSFFSPLVVLIWTPSVFSVSCIVLVLSWTLHSNTRGEGSPTARQVYISLSTSACTSTCATVALVMFSNTERKIIARHMTKHEVNYSHAETKIASSPMHFINWKSLGTRLRPSSSVDGQVKCCLYSYFTAWNCRPKSGHAAGVYKGFLAQVYIIVADFHFSRNLDIEF